MYSIAGETIELAKPVIGTSEPAPAILPILLKTFKAVKNALKNISEIETIVELAVVSRPLYLQTSIIICPIAQIKPPVQKLLKQFLKIGELGDFAKEYAESVYQSVGCIVVICDKDSIIAVSGLKRGQQSANMGIAIDKPIHTDIEKAIVERTKVNLSSSRNETMLRIASGDSDMQYCAELIVPILSSGDAIGAVILISAEPGTVFGQAETKVAETAASFMGKQLEN